MRNGEWLDLRPGPGRARLVPGRLAFLGEHQTFGVTRGLVNRNRFSRG